MARNSVYRLSFGLYRSLVRWLFERLYRELAWSYDLVAALVSGGAWRGWSLTALRFAAGRTLELGCGTGNLQRALALRPEIEAIGLDRSPQMVGRARRRAPTARLARADARALPLAGASFDAVVATFPSEYISDAATAAEIARVLRPGGTLAVALWAQLDGDSPYLRAIDLAYRVTLQRSPRAPRPARTVEPPPLPDAQVRLADALAAAGFDVTHSAVATRGGRVHYVVGTLKR